MIPNDTLVSLLKDACRAPSGDNVQPWRFRYDGSSLSLYNIPGIHNPHLDFDERGAYIAHGALIENLCIAAPHYGYAAAVTLFPDATDEHLVAQFRFSPQTQNDDPLYAAIATRATNRHPYKEDAIAQETFSALAASVEQIPDVRLVLVTGRNERVALARAVSRAEVVVLDHKPIADHFFADIVWTLEEEKRKKSGFFVRSLEFNPLQTFVFWLASKPRMMQFFRMLSLPRFIADQDAKLYATGAVTGGMFLKDESRESFIAAGRALERLWLTATEHHLGFQPLIGMSFIAYKSETGRSVLPSLLAREMHTALASAKQVLGGGKEEMLAILFRTGVAPAPSTYSSRKEPEVDFV
ncbi:MAG: hypothetical protein WCT45_01975 [Candidatus Paceibacterota bacterium]|jgi:hypothetical protein